MTSQWSKEISAITYLHLKPPCVQTSLTHTGNLLNVNSVKQTLKN